MLLVKCVFYFASLQIFAAADNLVYHKFANDLNADFLLGKSQGTRSARSSPAFENNQAFTYFQTRMAEMKKAYEVLNSTNVIEESTLPSTTTSEASTVTSDRESKEAF